ncbi:MAG TPA: putative LPS assembly protein LptD, partial [Aquabacterium sp.]|nr:putative LPS assembly protein LptD [Aquabacterium sp.]
MLPAARASIAAAAALATTRPRGRPAAVALAVAALCCPALAADAPAPLQPSTTLEPKPAGDAARQRPMLLQADSVKVRPDLDAVAEGGVEFRQSGLVLKADRLRYDSPSDTAVARGKVSILRDGMRYSGTELQLQVQRFEGFFLHPEFQFDRLGAGGRAERIDFIDSERALAVNALYTSCPRDDGSRPDWLLRTDRVKLDFEANEGVAEGAVLQFLGVPILGAPVLSFPLTDDRKSGWLPPTVGLDSRSGFALAVPYYWNIAPNRDATFTPTVLTRRGLALDSEFRYLEPRHQGRLRLNLLPDDRTTGSSRHAWEVDNEGWLGRSTRYRAQLQRVSDDDYWKDFPQVLGLKVPRLLGQDLQLQRDFSTRLGAATAYARVQHWQVLQTGSGSDLIVA